MPDIELCTCGGNVVYATVCVAAPHAINCPVGMAQVEAWRERMTCPHGVFNRNNCPECPSPPGRSSC